MTYTSQEVYEFISKQAENPIVEWRNCAVSGTKFAISQSDLDFYEKIRPSFGGEKYKIPAPTLCPEERHRRRMARRNERTLYKRKCDATQKSIVSMYSPGSPYTVYDQKEWRSDNRDPLGYAKEMDYSRPFFEQFRELMVDVPRASIVNTNSENSEYTNYTANNKDCYLIFSNSYGQNEKCLYGTCLARSSYCVDAIQLFDCSFCYWVVDCTNCHSVRYANNCKDCRDSYFLNDCIACSNCIGCYGLHNAQYSILNKQYSKEEFVTKKKELGLDTRSGIKKFQDKFDQFILQQPHKSAEIEESENCSGDIIQGSNNCNFCYDTADSENCKYLRYSVGQDEDTYDSSFLVDSKMCYENLSLVHGYHDLFCNIVRRETSDLIYCDNCFNSKNCFGCIGLRNKEYCIFNKQYTKEEYEEEVGKIIGKMMEDKEWGEFFPLDMSPFAYNETIAQEYFPLSKEEIQNKGYTRRKPEYSLYVEGLSAKDLPETIGEVDDSFEQKVILCEESGRPFRILRTELELYRKLEIPLPTKHPDVRHQERIGKRSGVVLYKRKSDKSGKDMISVHSPDVEFPVYTVEEYHQAF